ncbi:MAG: hypothetical protein AAF939_12845 [Planctomycetota bacterium]
MSLSRTGLQITITHIAGLVFAITSMFFGTLVSSGLLQFFRRFEAIVVMISYKFDGPVCVTGKNACLILLSYFLLFPITHLVAQEAVGSRGITAIPESVQLNGLVIEQKKYSLKIRTDDGEFQVKLANGAPIALKMNKPWFDWDNRQVVVDEMKLEDSSAPTGSRIAVDLPATDLFVVARFKNERQIDEIMSSNVKRVNYYLITPDIQETHRPTAAKPYLSGPLSIGKTDQPVEMKLGGEMLKIRLGFRFATMNGFSLAHLRPNATQVLLTGTRNAEANEVIAQRILFQPVSVSFKQ